ncbi:uncharacterized protein LOC132205766 [Neocloeon triangulifer]|uniref:uncharacterized protein LOC132205766 n=1 Tax=Neocloeon triangulifer TaxID=2078957 RepID=UPI00286F875A|nr:uncharacterized protein LOC132205766 [Neocloeon triangulifer]
MGLLTIQNDQKQLCFQNALVEQNFTAQKEIWTAGQQVPGCPGKYQWCSPMLLDFIRPDVKWENYDGTNEKEKCVILKIQGENVSVFDEPKLSIDDCRKEKSFICEGIPYGMNPTNGAVSECLEIYNIKPREIKKLDTEDYNSVSYSVKVYDRNKISIDWITNIMYLLGP